MPLELRNKELKSKPKQQYNSNKRQNATAITEN
jgi:hypothetical protein